MIAKPYVIVIGVDYSEVSRLALREALRTASDRTGSEVHVIHVETDNWLIPGPGADGEAAPEGRLLQSSTATGLTEALQRLHQLVTEEVTAFRDSLHDAAETAIRVVSHIRTNAPSREIAQIAADLVVRARRSHHRSWRRRAFSAARRDPEIGDTGARPGLRASARQKVGVSSRRELVAALLH